MLDNSTAVAVVHMEYHGWQCGAAANCSDTSGGNCANEALQLWRSDNGGWDWVPADAARAGPPANLIAVSPYTFEHARDVFNHSEMGFGDPTTMIRGRDGFFYVFIAASNPPPGRGGYNGTQQRGQCLLRSSEPLDPTSWRAWDGHTFSVRFADPYSTNITNVSAHTCQPVSTEAILVSVGWSTFYSRYIAASFGSYTYPNGTHIPCCGAWLYTLSDDLLTWDHPQLVRPCKQEPYFVDWEYDPSFLDETSGARNWHEVIGRSAYM